MKVLYNNSIQTNDWNELLRTNPFTTPFQTPAFFDFINSVPGLSAEVFAVEEKNEVLALCVVTFQKESGPKGFFSRRAIIYGGPLVKEGAGEALAYLLAYLKEHIKGKAIYIETRNYHEYKVYRSIFEKDGWVYQPYLDFQLNLKGKTRETVLAGMQYNRRHEIKQSLKEGLIYDECKNEQELKELYQILKNLYNLRVKLPLPSLIYFTKLFQSSISRVFIVRHNEKIVGGSICIVLAKDSIYTMYYCGLRNYHPKIFPTHIAILAAIEYAINNQIPMLDFMGAGKLGIEYGVREYKSKFGGDLVEHGRFLKVLNPFLYNIGKAGLGILAKIGK